MSNYSLHSNKCFPVPVKARIISDQTDAPSGWFYLSLLGVVGIYLLSVRVLCSISCFDCHIGSVTVFFFLVGCLKVSICSVGLPVAEQWVGQSVSR